LYKVTSSYHIVLSHYFVTLEDFCDFLIVRTVSRNVVYHVILSDI